MTYDIFSDELLRDRSHALGAEELRSMGKQASNMYLDGVCSLNDAVVKVAQQHSSIRRPQIERILEHANSVTFLDLFEKQADDKNVEFELADPKVVFQALEKTASPVVMTNDADYSLPPVSDSRVTNLEADLALMDVFGLNKVSADLVGEAAKKGILETDVDPEQLAKGIEVEHEHTQDPALAKSIAMDHLAEIPDYYTRLDEMERAAGVIKESMAKAKIGDRSMVGELEKRASLQAIQQSVDSNPYPLSNPYGELSRTKQRMEKLAHEAWVAAEKNSLMAKEAAENLRHTISQELLSGTDFGDLVHAMNHVAHEGWVKQAMTDVIPYLASRNFNVPALKASLIRHEMQKSASTRVPNPDNSVLESFAAYVKLASEQPRLNEALHQTQDLLGQIDDKVKEVMTKVGFVGKVVGKAAKGVGKSIIKNPFSTIGAGAGAYTAAKGIQPSVTAQKLRQSVGRY